ncbi:MAG: UDP-glucose/GDP-mannose dehydrogenase family protein, partial [bacterium]|nr:UDP-glucose/GDP-mannose dehydrogenase family protein [bacterium]
VRAYDPEAMEPAKKMLTNGVTSCEIAYDVADGSDALVLLTEWNQFRMLDMEKVKSLLRAPVVIDMRNIYEPKAMRNLGFNYVCVGRN